MKKTAIKGLVILAAVVLLCIFFAGSLHSLMTARVKTVTPKSGRLESTLRLTGQLCLPKAETVFAGDRAGEDRIVIRRVDMAAGSFAEEGSELFRYGLADAEEKLQTLSESYAAKEKELLQLERKLAGTVLTPIQEAWLDRYKALKTARTKTQALRVDFRASCIKEGIRPEGDALPPETPVSKELKEKENALTEALAEEETVQAVFEKQSLTGLSEELADSLIQKADLEEELDSLTEQMALWFAQKDEILVWSADREGYIVQAEIKEGDILSPEDPVFKMSLEGESPFIQLDAGSLDRRIEPGTAVTLEAGGRSYETVCGDMEVAAEGGRWLNVPLDRQGLSALGGASALAEEGSVTASIRSKAEESSTLIPTAALRGSEGAYYVYVVQSSINGLGAEKLTVTRKDVKLLGQNDSVSSIAEKPGNEPLAYMEDRPLSEGCEVQLYPKEEN